MATLTCSRRTDLHPFVYLSPITAKLATTTGVASPHQKKMTTKKSPSPVAEESFASLSRPTFQDYGPLPETPPAHVWALKALRNQLLGTRPSPLATTHMDDDIEEVYFLESIRGVRHRR